MGTSNILPNQTLTLCYNTLMKTAIIIHGMPSKEEYLSPKFPSPSNAHWFPWLQKQLTMNGTLAETPEMPEPYEPDYKKWCEVFEQFKLDGDTLLIGHSCGGGFLVRWLSENKVKVGKVILVAPWIDPNKEFAPKMFADLKIEDISSFADEIHLFISTDDDKEELDTAEILKNNIKKLKVSEFHDKGHFITDHMKTNEFPELLKVI